MIPPHIVRVLASARVPSSHGPDVDYEMLHATVSSGPDHKVTHEAVIVRLVVGNIAQNNLAVEVLPEDMAAFQAQWSRFVMDVIWRRAEAGDAEARAALDKIQSAAAYNPAARATPPPSAPAISASGGRYGNAPADVPLIPIKKEKKKSEGPPEAPIIPGITSAGGGRKYFGKIIEDETPHPASPDTASRKAIVPGAHQIIGFNLSTPPTADGLMRTVVERPDQLLVVCPMGIAAKVEEFIKAQKAGTVKGRPTAFNPLVIFRREGGGPVPHKKLRAEVAGGIARILGDPTSALWIMPE